jgi:hypothetical protein
MILIILSKVDTYPLNRQSSIIDAICPSTDRVLHTQLTKLLQQIQTCIGIALPLLQQILNVGESWQSTQNNRHVMKASNANGKVNTSSLE